MKSFLFTLLFLTITIPAISTAGGVSQARWAHLNGPGGEIVYSIALCCKIIFAGTYGEVYLSTSLQFYDK